MGGAFAAIFKAGALKAGPVGFALVIFALALIYVYQHRASAFQGLAIIFSAVLVVFGGMGLIVNLSPMLGGARTVEPIAVSISAVFLIVGFALAVIVHLRIAREQRDMELLELRAREETARLKAEQERRAQERRDARNIPVRAVGGLMAAVPRKAVALLNPPAQMVGRVAARLLRRGDARTKL